MLVFVNPKYVDWVHSGNGEGPSMGLHIQQRTSNAVIGYLRVMHVTYREVFEPMRIRETSKSNAINIFRALEDKNLLEGCVNLGERTTRLPQEVVYPSGLSTRTHLNSQVCCHAIGFESTT